MVDVRMRKQYDVDRRWLGRELLIVLARLRSTALVETTVHQDAMPRELEQMHRPCNSLSRAPESESHLTRRVLGAIGTEEDVARSFQVIPAIELPAELCQFGT